jgi:hypothetical protein
MEFIVTDNDTGQLISAEIRGISLYENPQKVLRYRLVNFHFVLSPTNNR